MTRLDDRLMFVLSAPRSGSTLLARLLGQNPEISYGHELYVIPTVYHLGYFASVDNVGFARPQFYNPVLAARATRSIVEQLPGGEGDYLDAVRAYTDAIYSGLLKAGGRRVLCDKTPANIRYADLLFRLYPNAKYVVLTRNPIAVAFSYRGLASNQEWWREVLGPESPAYREFVAMDPAAWAVDIARQGIALAASILRAGTPKAIHIRYEDLVRDTVPTLRQACDFFGIEFDDDMTRYEPVEHEGEILALGDPFTVDRHTEAVTAPLARWRQQLSEEGGPAFARRVLDAVDCDDMALLGYDDGKLAAIVNAT